MMNVNDKTLVLSTSTHVHPDVDNKAVIEDLVDEGCIALSGSRYFASRPNAPIELVSAISDDTDFDYYGAYNSARLNEITNRLSCTVRHEADPKYPFDNLAVCIITVHDINAQIILRRDAGLYSWVQESITVDFYYNFLWKRGPKKPSREEITAIYNQLFATAEKMC